MGPRRWSARRAAAAAASAILVACSAPAKPGAMLRIDPPAGWVEALHSGRAAKDAWFREDPSSPLLAEARSDFEGLEYFEPDPRLYFVGRVQLYLEPESFEIVATSGAKRPCAKVGWVGFAVDGLEYRLQVYRLLDQERQEGDPGYFLPFQDETTGRETYPAGRYVELDGPAGGPFVLDFNTAYNPYCAYGAPARDACPVTPRENRLPLRIAAGERGWHPRAEAAVP
jgi:uncharacterized protein (DUF1684 family)